MVGLIKRVLDFCVVVVVAFIFLSFEAKALSDKVSMYGNNVHFDITNFGNTTDDVGFYAYLSDYAMMTSFTMQTQRVIYMRKDVKHQVAQAKNYSPTTSEIFLKRTLDLLASELTQTVHNTAHVKGNMKKSFDLNYDDPYSKPTEATETRFIIDMYGSNVQNMVGEVFSPNYPSSYPNLSNFTWTIRVANDNVVRLSIVDLDIEECCDRLTIYDGNSFSGSILASLSGNLNNQNNLTAFVSTGSSLSLQLKSGESGTNVGFRASVSVDPSPLSAACSGGDYLYLFSGEGHITSPNYPVSYYDNMQCSWTIHTINNDFIKLSVLDLALAANDSLVIYDGYAENNAVLAVYAGTVGSLDPLYSSGYYMLLKFISDEKATNRGFQLKYETSSSGNFPSCTPNQELIVPFDDYVTITSPNYPNVYSKNLNCSWLVQSQFPNNSYTAELTVEDLKLSLGDEVLVYDNFNGNLISRLYDSISYSPIYSTHDKMFIVFLTDSFYASSGFRFRLAEVLPEAPTTESTVTTEISTTRDTNPTNITVCTDSEIIDIYSGYSYITSPNYPNNYENGADCSLTILSHSGYYIKLTVVDLALANSDVVIVYDGTTITDDVLATYTGYANDLDSLYSSQYEVHLTFMSNEINADRGFKLRYEISDYPVYNFTYYTSSDAGYLASYNYGYGNYPNDLTQTWIFPENFNHIRLRFTRMFTESCCDKLTLYSYNNVVNDWSGRLAPGFVEDIYPNDCNSGCGMWLSFTSDSSADGVGFYLDYELYFTIIACEGGDSLYVYYDPEYLMSPYYPSNYYNDMTCSWSIMSYYGYHVKLTLLDFALAPGDTLTVHNGQYDTNTVLVVYSGHIESATPVFSTSYNMLLKFESNNVVSDRGFHVEYEMSTNVNITEYLTDPSGNITSYYYGNGYYPSRLSQIWYFPQNYSGIGLTFNFMCTEPDTDFISIYSHDNLVKQWSGNYTSGYYEEIRPTECTAGCEFWITFLSTSGVSELGFHISYDLFDKVL